MKSGHGWEVVNLSAAKDLLDVFTLVSVLSVISLPADAQQCPAEPSLPAYSHNDYRNDRPLHDALVLGYRGVEADFVLEDGKLLVGHSQKEADPSRTLEQLYLDPLRELIRRCDRLYPDSSPFLLSIESKDGGRAAYHALQKVLLSYQDILSTTRNPGHVSRPVQVVLVGWHPPLEELAAESVTVAKVQGWITHGGMRLPKGPPQLVGLLSLNYGRTLRWRGRGPLAAGDRKVLAHVSRARQRFPGISIRAFNVPADPKVYQLLFDAGVSSIGTEDIKRTREILRERRTSETMN